MLNTKMRLRSVSNRRTAPDAEWSGLIFFSSRAGGGAAWDGHRLTIHLLKADLPKVNIDLIWREGPQTWDGLFELGCISRTGLAQKAVFKDVG